MACRVLQVFVPVVLPVLLVNARPPIYSAWRIRLAAVRISDVSVLRPRASSLAKVLRFFRMIRTVGARRTEDRRL